LKFGPSRIEFAHFPFHPGETLSLHWVVPSGLTQAARGTFTLRCVEEWYEKRVTGRNQRRQLVQEAVWSVTGYLDQSRALTPGRPEELRFDIPAGTPGTRMNAKDSRPVFWELVIELDLAGLDFKEGYMVPIYRREGTDYASVAPMRLPAA